MNSGESPTVRTTKILLELMNKILPELVFTGENTEMFTGSKLPTLDTAIWCQDNHILYSFYEKPTLWKRVLQKMTALDPNTIASSLRHEVIRRLANMSYNIEHRERELTILNFAQKMINSGFSRSLWKE